MNLNQIPQIHNEAELIKVLDSFEVHLKTLKEKISRLQFKKLLEKCRIPEINKLQKQYAEQILNPRFISLINNWVDYVKDPLLKRRLTLWKKHISLSKVHLHPEIRELTRELEDEMITYQYIVNDKKSDLGTIKNILRTSPNQSLRKAAWISKYAISKSLAPRLLKLIRLRNDLAKEEGYTTYADMILEMDGLTLKETQTILNDLIKASNPIYNQILTEGQKLLGLNQIEPWDIMYLLETMSKIDTSLFPKNLIENKLKSWGKTHGADLEKLGIKMVCTDIPYNGLCITLNDNEIKILTNPADGYNSYRTMFHELGHALHSAYNQQKSIIFRNDSGPFTEGMAELIAYITRHPQWLKGMGIDSKQIHSVRKRLIASWFHYLRERTAYALTEYIIYENPSTNPDKILAQMEHDILGITLNETPRWAANSWYINYPVYWQNYILADLIASQIHRELNQRYGGLHGHPEAFREVCQIYYGPGASVDWQEKLLKHTGSKLKVDALIKDLQFYLED
ncbi:hypothetical protein BBF96_04365 [Anoxybacter fermentans]|uniref:Peptidase M3A/M3B catalytic domain-containing protein n=1 Tax=Anoxybacter fermentans TaxID=1323375 RepID=A0A3Q9HPS8_9FIRM|nr:M2 family metallopeptidase [Anoxybacter fermentans]AZR72691.1 hypothetical protein BBF96_04365 [Anoxybacter fermentans]